MVRNKIRTEKHTMNLKSNINGLPPYFLKIIKAVSVQADRVGVNAYIVGGVVRDLIIGRNNFDLDLVIEGDAIRFGKILRDIIKGAMVAHHKFGTVSIVHEWPASLGKCPNYDNKLKIDIATARKEEYSAPAALPHVKSGSLKEDLFRRDFTINAMAAVINRKGFGTLIDHFGGIDDLRKKEIRVLHEKSLVDDPTRIFRAIRFEQRFGFKIEKHTEELIKHAVNIGMFGKTENQRIRNELILIFGEENPEKAVKRMKQLHGLRFIHRKIGISRDISRIYKRIRTVLRWYCRSQGEMDIDVWLINFMPLLEGLKLGQLRDVAEKFRLTRKEREKLINFGSNHERLLKSISQRWVMSPGEVFDTLENNCAETLLFCMARAASLRAVDRIKKYIDRYSLTELSINGKDLKKIGISPGPAHRHVLRKVLHEKLGGKALSHEDELRIAEKYSKSGYSSLKQ